MVRENPVLPLWPESDVVFAAGGAREVWHPGAETRWL